MNEIPTYYEPPTQESKNLVKVLSTRKQFDSVILNNMNELELNLRAELTDTEYNKIFSIGQFILTGMSLNESLTLTFMSEDEFERLTQKSSFVGLYVDFNEMVYKAQLTRTLTGAALSGSEKIAGWLMERKYAEYSAKDRKELDDDKRGHVLDEGMDYVRKNGDSKPLIALPY